MPISEMTAATLNSALELPPVLSSQVKIRFQDCDPFGHLNNGAYLNYLINAREDQVAQQYGLDIYQWGLTHGTSWVVGKHEIVYRKPAFYNEVVTIRSRLLQYSEKQIFVEAAMLDADASQVKAVLWSSFVHVDMQAKRPTTHIPELLELFAKVVQPISDTSIEARAKSLADSLSQPQS